MAVSDGNMISSSPAIGADGTVYVGSNDFSLYAFHISSEGKGVISGRIDDMTTDQPLTGATITTNTGMSTTTDTSGRFYLLLDPGTYQVNITKQGYQTSTIANVTIKTGGEVVVQQMLPSSGPLNLTRDNYSAASTGKDYRERVWISGGVYPYLFTIAYGALPAGLSLSSDGFITGTPTTPGSYTFAVGVRDNTQNGYSHREYTIDVTTPLIFTTTALPRATKNLLYLYDLSITGGLPPYTIIKETGTLPTGLTLSSTGRITGTPTTTGSATFTAKVTDAAGRTLSHYIPLPVDDPLAISTPNLNTGITGQAYNQTLQATGGYGSYTWSIYSGTLPQGINLDTATGVLSGTPQAASTIPLVIMAEDSVGRQAFQNMTLIVTAPLAFVTTPLPYGAKNATYSDQIRISGGLAPYQLLIRYAAYGFEPKSDNRCHLRNAHGGDAQQYPDHRDR
jgi:hypothetical protein